METQMDWDSHDSQEEHWNMDDEPGSPEEPEAHSAAPEEPEEPEEPEAHSAAPEEHWGAIGALLAEVKARTALVDEALRKAYVPNVAIRSGLRKKRGVTLPAKVQGDYAHIKKGSVNDLANRCKAFAGGFYVVPEGEQHEGGRVAWARNSEQPRDLHWHVPYSGTVLNEDNLRKLNKDIIKGFGWKTPLQNGTIIALNAEGLNYILSREDRVDASDGTDASAGYPFSIGDDGFTPFVWNPNSKRLNFTAFQGNGNVVGLMDESAEPPRKRLRPSVQSTLDALKEANALRLQRSVAL